MIRHLINYLSRLNHFFYNYNLLTKGFFPWALSELTKWEGGGNTHFYPCWTSCCHRDYWNFNRTFASSRAGGPWSGTANAVYQLLQTIRTRVAQFSRFEEQTSRPQGTQSDNSQEEVRSKIQMTTGIVRCTVHMWWFFLMSNNHRSTKGTSVLPESRMGTLFPAKTITSSSTYRYTNARPMATQRVRVGFSKPLKQISWPHVVTECGKTAGPIKLAVILPHLIRCMPMP